MIALVIMHGGHFYGSHLEPWPVLLLVIGVLFALAFSQNKESR